MKWQYHLWKTMSTKPLNINEEPIKSVETAKLVGVYIQSNLKWNAHVDFMIKKAHPRLYFLSQLRRARATSSDMVKFYTTIVRPVLEYAAPAWSSSLPEYLIYKIEQIQKRAMKIIHPGLRYETALQKSGLRTLLERRKSLCASFFHKIEQPNDKIHHLLPDKRDHKYGLRKQNKYCDIRTRTDRYKKSFIPYNIANFK